MSKNWLTDDEVVRLMTQKNHIFIPKSYLLLLAKKRKIHTLRTGTYSRLYSRQDAQKFHIKMRT